mmetsp:Transcript_3408/g.11533  ORF Transcript_3408/g.11533 Transcript_3408/m.11533 type:complete len:239 (+) Transcript_3408:2312-3028(+)
MKIFSSLTPIFNAFTFAGPSSSPWPKSAVNVTTSHPYVSCNHLRMMEVSNPPEYARTTFFTSPDGPTFPAIGTNFLFKRLLLLLLLLFALMFLLMLLMLKDDEEGDDDDDDDEEDDDDELLSFFFASSFFSADSESDEEEELPLLLEDDDDELSPPKIFAFFLAADAPSSSSSSSSLLRLLRLLSTNALHTSISVSPSPPNTLLSLHSSNAVFTFFSCVSAFSAATVRENKPVDFKYS